MLKEAMLYEKLDAGRVHCFLCSHNCKIAEGKFGICGVRQNVKGELNTLVWADVIASHVDPIEKKPLYHFLPGSKSFSIATIGCNFKCGFCQNWQISQVSKETAFDLDTYELKPEEVLREAKKSFCKSISYTYTEPTIFFEYAYDTAKLAKKEGLYNIFVTNGFMTKEAIKVIRPYLDAANIDLKFFKESSYNNICKARLQPVLDSIKAMNDLGIWVEITTLIIPGLNDSREELKGISDFIASINKSMPWHISAFHPDYKYADYQPTPIEILKKAYDIGRKSGLNFVYLGNVPEEGNTYCPGCNSLLVRREYFSVIENNIKSGKCCKCNIAIPGTWD